MKNHKKFSLIFLAMALGALIFFSPTTNPVWSQEDNQETESQEDLEKRSGALETFEAHPDLATIYVVRERKFKGSAVKKKIYFNYQYMGKIGNAKYAVYLVPPGEYLLGVLEDKDKRSITLKVEAGKLYFAHLRLKMGIAKARGEFRHISEEDARALIPELYMAKNKDINQYPNK